MQKDFMKKVLKNGRRIISYILILLIICTMTAVAFPLKASARSDYGFDDYTLSWNNGEKFDHITFTYGARIAICFSSEDLLEYDGRLLKSVSIYDYSANSYTLTIYESFYDNLPNKQKLLAIKPDCVLTGSGQYVEHSLDTPIVIDAKKGGLWIEYSPNESDQPESVACAKQKSGTTKGDWWSNDGVSWYHLGEEYLIKANLVGEFVSFDANGGTGNMNPIEFKVGEDVKLSANSFTYDGKYFIGWDTDSEAKTPKYSDEQTITPSRSTKLYAIWQDKESQEINASDISVMIDETGKSIAATLCKGDGNLSYSVKSGTSVTIDSEGNITTVEPGDTIITVTALAAEKYFETTKDITITVTEKPAPVVEEKETETNKEPEQPTIINTGEKVVEKEETIEEEKIVKEEKVVEKEETVDDEKIVEKEEIVEEEVVDVVEEGDFLDSLRTELSIAADLAKNTNQHQVVNYQADYSALPYEFMKLLQDNPQITLNLTFPFEGEMVTVTISGDKVVADSTIPWYGPAYMMGRFSGSGNANAANTGVYIVKKGDTLSDIAYLFGTTVEALVEKNGIKNRDLIYIGQEIKY